MTSRTRTPAVRKIIAAGTLALVVALSGCLYSTKGTDAMLEESERLLAIAEEVLPELAQVLDLTVGDASSSPRTDPGSEGTPSTFRFSVRGEFVGKLPTQHALEDAIIAAGFTHVITENVTGHARPGTDERPRVVAQNKDESVEITVQLVTDVVDAGLRFSVHSLNSFYISDKAKREYFWDLVPEFDQSLVEPHPGARDMAAISNQALGDAEDMLSHISQALSLSIAEAETWSKNAPGTERDLTNFTFGVYGTLHGEIPTQHALEAAMKSAGLNAIADQSEFFSNPGSDDDPHLAAATPDEFIQLVIAADAGKEGESLSFSLRIAPQSGFSESAYDVFFPDRLPKFDQSLIESAP